MAAGHRGGGRGARARRPFKTFAYGFLLLALAVAGSAAALVYREFTASLPPVEKLLDYHPPVATRVYAAGGELIGEFFVEKRYLVPIHRIPRGVQLAFVAAEDAKFYDHTGIDPLGILRAALRNASAGSTRQGGSTITQQVVKQLLLSPERSIERKLKEALLAFRIEKQLTKDEILYLYLNQIFLGNGAYGVQAASLEYFGKDVSGLTLGEAAMLAGLPQAPSRYAPNRHMRQARARQRYVLERMVEEGFITRDDAERAAIAPIALARHRPSIVGPAAWFVQHVRRLLEERYGSSGPASLGLEVHTTLDLRLQEQALAAVAAGIAALDARQGFRGPLRRLGDAERIAVEREARQLAGRPPAPLPVTGSVLEAVVVPGRDGAVRRRDGSVAVRWAGGLAVLPRDGLERATRSGWVPRAGDVLEAVVRDAGEDRRELALSGGNGTQGALLAMVPQTGDVKAMVGGLDFEQSQFNRATQALRQPGSSFKPLVYAAALDHGFTPASIVVDAPVSYRAGGQRWAPQNFDHRFHGPTSVRDALTFSRNVVSVKLADAVGIGTVIDYLGRFGFERPLPRNLSIALGSSEVTLLELVRAYTAFPTLGVRVEPRFVTRIVDGEGQVLDGGAAPPVRVMPQATAYLMVSMLRSAVEHGTGRPAAIDRPFAGKTGTTNDQRDAWFIGFTPDLLAGVWVGYDQEKSLAPGETGGRAAAPIWRSFMASATEGQPVPEFPVPNDIVLVNVDRRSGLRAGADTPAPLLEAFRRGTEPTDDAPAAAGARTGAGAAAGEPADLDAATLREIRRQGAAEPGGDEPAGF